MASALILLSTLKDARYKAFSNGEDLNEAISDAEEAVRLTPVESIRRATRLNNLANRCIGQYNVTAQLEDLENAIRNSTAAVAAEQKSLSEMHVYSINLGNRFHYRYIRLGHTNDLSQAIRILNDALSMAPESSRPTYLGFLSRALIQSTS
jgi:tetratricopeptide (TPR) repeat protein